MAVVNNKEGGYECEFVEKPPEALQSFCPECQLILREPYQANCCGYVFCQTCIDGVKSSDKPCPCCKTVAFGTFEDKRLKRSLYTFRILCTNKQQGCQWEGELGQLDNHLNYNPTEDKQLEGCQFTEIKCYNCTDFIKRSNIIDHQTKECLKRRFSCEYCEYFDSSYEDVTTNHWPVCDDYPLPCPNKCGEMIQRQNFQSHITDDCPLTNFDCDFQHVGCEVRIPRKDMPAHLQEGVVRHLSLQAASFKPVVANVSRLEEENKQLKEQVATTLKLEKVKQQVVNKLVEANVKLRQQVEKLTQDLQTQRVYTPICPVEFTMTNFDQKRKDGERWQSPPFYTHVEGYRMCLRVYAGGCATGTGRDIAISICMMKGEFDEQLSWPFSGQVEIELLNNCKDEQHYKGTVDYGSASVGKAGNRVTKQEESKCERCTFNFISHSALRPKYLNISDCLKFRITSK